MTIIEKIKNDPTLKGIANNRPKSDEGIWDWIAYILMLFGAFVPMAFLMILLSPLLILSYLLCGDKD